MKRHDIKLISGIATVNNPSGANVHIRPNQKTKVKEVVPAGTNLPFFRVYLDWYEVTLVNGEFGWIRGSDVGITYTPKTIQPIPMTNLQDAIITIDAGHGGSEPGAANPDTGYPEKNGNLDIALKLKQFLLSAGAGKVWMTRETDQDVSLAYRADVGTASGGHLFLSIHNNASSDRSVHGTETYYQCGSEQTTDTKNKSFQLAGKIQGNLLLTIDASHCVTSLDRGVKCRLNAEGEDYYYVLRNAFIPSVLVECVFISNPDEGQCLEQDIFKTKLAEGLGNGIVRYLTTA